MIFTVRITSIGFNVAIAIVWKRYYTTIDRLVYRDERPLFLARGSSRRLDIHIIRLQGVFSSLVSEIKEKITKKKGGRKKERRRSRSSKTPPRRRAGTRRRTRAPPIVATLRDNRRNDAKRR